MKIAYAMIVATLFLVPSISIAADASPAEIAFWQSVQNSKSADELNLYLQTYPDGAYAALARVKIKELGGTPAEDAGAPAATAQAAPAAPAPARADISSAVIIATPATIGVGDQVTVSFDKLPKPGLTDKLIVVNAGAPDTTGTTAISDSGVLASNYMSNGYVTDGTLKLGPFAPGKYEIRWVSSLYNNFSKLETVARTHFEVDP